MEPDPWLVRLDKVKPTKQEWLWKGFFPVGELSILAGIQGIGKSLTAIDVIARVTSGRPWPDKSKCKEGSALILAAEDHISNTIRPRLDASLSVPKHVMAILGAPDRETGGIMPFDIFSNMPQMVNVLENMQRITGLPPRLVVIDPLTSYVGGIDSNRETQVRKVLFTLRANIAVKYNVAIICIMHVKKGADEAPALERIMGSVAFTGSARSVWAFCQCPDDDDKRYMVPVKANLIKRTTAGYELFVASGRNGQGVIKWGDPSDKVAEDLMVDRGMRPEAKKTRAMEIIKDHLQGGPQPAGIIQEAVMQDDISRRTCDNAKRELGVRSVKSGNMWMWWLPGIGSKLPVKKKEVKKAKPVVSERDKLVKAIKKRAKPLNRKSVKKGKDVLKQEEIDRVTRCVREFESEKFFAPEPEE